MAANKRIHRRNFNEPGHAHELTFTCYQGYSFLRSDRTCQWLADAIDAARKSHYFALWAYVFMPNHVHLIVYPERPEYDIAAIRSAIKQPVVRRAISYLRSHAPEWIKRLTRRRGKRNETHFRQSGGGYDRNVVEAKTLLKMIDYLHLNPLCKKLVANVSQYKWSSASWFLHGVEGPLRLDTIPSYWLAT